MAALGNKDEDPMSQFTLLTGATGLVGSFLMRDLLSAAEPLAVLARSTAQQTAAERIDERLSAWEERWNRKLPRPVCIEGDVNQRHLGMDEATRRWIGEHCRRVIHSAAILKFSGDDQAQDPWRTNVDGTRRVLSLCRETGLRELHYVSTAYVCGTRAGTIYESQLDLGQSFRNDYERSKYLAEQLVRNDDFLDRPTIYRPAVIAGDSVTGTTISYHGLFTYLRSLALLARRIDADASGIRRVPLRLAMNGDERRNLVPVDWVSRVIHHLVNTPDARGETFHLSPQDATTTRDLYEAAFAYFDCEGFEFLGNNWNHRDKMTRLERLFLTHSESYRDYECSDPVFDTTNLRRHAVHLPCPQLDAAMVRRFCEFGEQDSWGARTKTPIVLPLTTAQPAAAAAAPV